MTQHHIDKQRQAVLLSNMPNMSDNFFRRIWRKVRIALLVIFAVFILGLVLLYQHIHAIAQTIVISDVRPNPPLTMPIFGMNLLIIGVDERPDNPEEGVRSDTLLMVHIDTLGRWANLLSIPRDTQVNLLDIGETKINVAYGQGYARATELYGAAATSAQGGMALASETVERFLGEQGGGIRADYLVQVNFDGFVQIIDRLGGITIDVPEQIIDEAYPTADFGTMRVEFQPGLQRMSGERALIYARTRHADSDFHRSHRQQQVMQAILAELQKKSWIGRIIALPSLLEGLTGQEGSPPPILTTLPIDRIDVLLALAWLVSGLNADSLGYIPINPETVQVTEIGTNLVWDPQDVHTQVIKFIKRPE